LGEPYFDVKFSTIFALGRRGDLDALPALENLRKSGEFGLGNEPFLDAQISALKAKASGEQPKQPAPPQE
jgi:hypothetical protein